MVTRIRAWLAATCIAQVLLAPVHARADTTSDLQTARGLIEAFDFDAALPILRGVVQASAATPGQRVSAQELLIVSLLTLGERSDALREAHTLLDLDPGYRPEPERHPPPVVELLQIARGEHSSEALVTLELDLAQSPRVAARCGDPRGVVQGVVVHYRAAGQPTFRTLVLRRELDQWTGTLPGAQGQMELYGQALAVSGAPLATWGSQEEPALMSTANQREEDLPPRHGRRGGLSRAWFWSAVVITGAMAVTGTALGLVTSADHSRYVDGGCSEDSQETVPRQLSLEQCRDLADGGLLSGRLSTGFFVAAVAALATAIILYLQAPPQPTNEVAQASDIATLRF